MKDPYKIKHPRVSTSRFILLMSVAVFVLLVIIAWYIGDIAIGVNMVFLGMLVLVVPYSVYKFFHLKRITAYENEFPNFLRDISENQRAGLSLIQSIQAASKSDYGSLSKEIKKINNQLSWNIPLERVLKSFVDRLSDSNTIVRAIMVIDQANKSGGNVEDTMESLANNIESIRDTQQEKAVLLNQQVLMMYAIFFIFLGITIALIKFLIPLLEAQTQTGGFGIQGFNPNPCSVCTESSDFECTGCKTFEAIGIAFDLGESNDTATYYKSLFLAMILVQGFFSGLIAGQIGSDSVTVGIKHSLIMLLSGFIIFIIIIRTGIV